MQRTTIGAGDAVYVRAYSTHRAAVAELISLVHDRGREWGQVRLATEWYDWDGISAAAGPAPRAGEVLQVESYRLEPVRW